MLKIIEVNSQAEKQIPLSSHKPLEHTWVVADLNSKAQIQTGLLQKYKCLPENAVLRISELWQKILHQSFADIEVVSSHFVSTVLAEWLKKRDLPWARHPGTPKMLTQYIAQFLPILIQPQVSNKMREWLLENPDALMRWGNWFELSDQAWGYFCKEKMLSVTWVSAYLSARDWGGIMWNNRLMIDIGADITGVEIDLFKKLAQDIEVTILSPPSVWCEKYSSTLWAYNILSERPAELKTPVVNDNLKNKRSCRYTTQISEVKAVVAQVRQWLERDVPTEKIAILAADIEQYWPSLQSYLFKEGVPVAKDVVMRAGSVPGVSKWLARIKIESRDIDSGDLEASVFGRDQESPINYEKFQQLFNKIYDDDDLNRDLKIRNLFDFKLKSTDRIDREEFFAWAIRFWFDDLIGIDRISAEILKECPVQVRLELSSWISYLVALVAKIEIKISEGPNAGVICSNFDAAQNLDIHYAVMLGLSEGELQSPSDLSVTRSDVAKIAQDLGVFLESPDRRYNEYLADKISSEIKNEVILSFAATDFSGQAQAPSLFWLQTARVEEGDIEVCHMPGSTRWDEIQNSSLEKSAIAPILKYIEQDIGLQPIENFKSARNLRISPSQMEKYLNCPFIFAAEKVFSLSDLPDVDLDVDAMTSGRIMHALLDQLLAEPLHFNWTDAELEKLIDKVKVSLALTIGEERLWPAKRQHYLRLAKNFIEFEKAWRAQFPYTQTIGRELRVKGKMILTDGLSVEVSGQIDRVDIYSNGKLSSPQYAVIDYKSSAAGLHNYGSWLKNDELQLAFYTLAIAQGLTELAIGDVIGAFYFVLSNMNRERGYRVSENVNLLFSENKRNRTQITAENLDVLLNEIKYKIAEVVKKIETGQFQAQPKDIKDCFHCSWRTLCRAPHLN